VGAVLFGRRGDRRGRQRVFAAMILLMSLATTGIGLLPGEASIGLLAPVVLVVLRSAQGLSAGGEASSASAFVVEYAPAHRRGWYGACLWATIALGLGAGIAMAAVLARLLPGAMVQAWGWRVAFLVVLPLGLAGLYLRLRLDETPHFRPVERVRPSPAGRLPRRCAPAPSGRWSASAWSPPSHLPSTPSASSCRASW
jgi:MFS transporter, MHS family, proline/betaine transporter